MAAPNQNKESRTIIPGIWGDVLRTYQNLSSARLLTTTLTQVEAAIIEGDFYRAFKVITVPASGKAYMKFTAPPASAGRVFGLVLREITPTAAGLWYRVRSNFDASAVIPGSEWPIFNENGRSTKQSVSTFQDVDEADIVGFGEVSDIAYIPQGITGQKTQGSLAREQGFKIVDEDTELLVEFENLATSSNETLVYYQYIESPIELVEN